MVSRRIEDNFSRHRPTEVTSDQIVRKNPLSSEEIHRMRLDEIRDSLTWAKGTVTRYEKNGKLPVTFAGSVIDFEEALSGDTHVVSEDKIRFVDREEEILLEAREYLGIVLEIAEKNNIDLDAERW